MMVHQIPLLSDVKVQVPDSSVVSLTRRVKISRLEELVAFLPKLVGFLKSSEPWAQEFSDLHDTVLKLERKRSQGTEFEDI